MLLTRPDPDYWRQYYPHGVGCSAFSAPAFQALMAECGGENPQQRFWVVDAPQGSLSFPVFFHSKYIGRCRLSSYPVAYYATPVEKAVLSAAELRAVVSSLSDWHISSHTFWLPPWQPVEAIHTLCGYRGAGVLSLQSVDTYVIELNDSAEQHIQKRVNGTYRRYLRKNRDQGVFLEDNPSAQQLQRYCDLYNRVYHGRGWGGDRFSQEFFRGVLERLERGGELVVAMHDGAVIGGGVLLYDHHAVHYFQGVIDREVKGVYPHVALYEYALQQAQERGLGRVNLGGVNEGNEGLARFKRSWGASARPLTRVRWFSGPRVIAKRLLRR